MEVKVKKPQKETVWEFPCKGIRKSDGLIVGFKEIGIGTVIDAGTSDFKLYHIACSWFMDQFTPIEEESQSEKNEGTYQKAYWKDTNTPVWTIATNGDIILLCSIDGNEVSCITMSEKVNYTCKIEFNVLSDRDEWLNSLELLPEATKIEIII